MKNIGRNIFIVVLILFVTLRLTGALVLFKISSTSSEPNLSLGDRFIGTNLKTSKALEFAYFKFSDSLESNNIIVKRLIALPHDKLECKNGEYYVNDVNVDKNLNLRYSYKIHQIVYNKDVKTNFKKEDAIESFLIRKDTVLVFLDNSFVANLPIELKRNVYKNSDDLSKDILQGNLEWNPSDFGPVVLPEGKYFFSGDNRDNSIDSRHRGFVDEENIKGTLLFKF